MINKKIFYAIYGEFDNLDKPIELLRLSSITDEDAIEVGKMIGIWSRFELNMMEKEGGLPDDLLIVEGKGFTESVGKEWGLKMGAPFAGGVDKILQALDFLRSKSYLLPWMGLTPDEIIARGWARYKELDKK